MKVIGMISGTSYDGIDVACCEFTQSDDELTLKQHGFISVEYYSASTQQTFIGIRLRQSSVVFSLT